MSLRRVLFVPDTHAPYHDRRAWALMLKGAKAFGPHTVVHLGDLADMYTVSSHSKNPKRALQLDEELFTVRQCRAQLEDLDASKYVFIEGNHEDRLNRYLQDKAPELFGTITIPQVLQLERWEFVPYKQHYKLGALYLTHDTGQGGKYTTARAMETFQHSVVIGHHHAMQYHVAGNAVGEYMVGSQFGWLGDVEQVDYMHRVKALRSWALGFGVGYHDTKTGVVYITPVPIVKNTCCVNGKVYRG